MRNAVTGCLVLLLALAVGAGVSAQFGWDYCPSCHYKFDGPVPPPTVGGVATGSGFVVHPDGYILTNYHVIEGSRSVQVKVGGREYTATVVESLPAQDLALLKVDARGLPAVALGDSDLLQVGDDVFAIGCPGGVCGTVTAGRVANMGVTITVEGGKQLQGMLMVDITTDHGSSGGPLVNSRGEVVGVTTAGKQGSFGFSIPIRQAIPLLRGIPGFSTVQMGQATAELPFREIRDRMTPVTAFILTDQGAALRLPPRYDTTRWPRASGGMQCQDPLDSSSLAYCYLDRAVPAGHRLVGYDEGRADGLSWTRSFTVTKGSGNLSVKFTQWAFASVLQFASSEMARAAADVFMRCAESVTVPDEFNTCLRHRNPGSCPVLLATSDKYGLLVVRRQLVAHDGLTGPGGWGLGDGSSGALIYSVVGTLESFVIRLVIGADMDCQNCRQTSSLPPPFGSGTYWVQRVSGGVGGLYLEEISDGRVSFRHTAMTYDAFINWATDREKELLEFILAQF